MAIARNKTKCASTGKRASRDKIEGALRFVAQYSLTLSGKAFFPPLVRYLSETLEADYALLARLLDDGKTVETMSIYAKGTLAPNIKYCLAGTPCEKVVGKRLCFFPKKIQALFPRNHLLAEIKAESYAGMPLWDSQGNAIGLIAVLDGKPFNNKSLVTAVLQLVSMRAAAELERQKNEEILLRSYETLEQQIQDRTTQLRSLVSELTVAEEKERRRIASGLHDDICQMLVAAKLRLKSLSRPNNITEAKQVSQDIEHFLDHILASARSLTFDLVSPSLHALGLEAAVEDLCERLTHQHHIRFTVLRQERHPPMTGDMAIILFHILRELLQNVVKHAHATRSTVTFHHFGNQVHITVEDNGTGFYHKPETETFKAGGGFGLFSIQDRIRYLGGELAIEPVTPHGSRALLTIPLSLTGPSS